MSLVAILCEPLIVALANVPFKPALEFIAYKVCAYTTCAIVNLMLIGIVWMLLRKKTTGLATSKPETLAGLMVALCGSNMLEDFANLSMLGQKERDAIINGWGKEYSMGTILGADEIERQGIDEAVFVSDAGHANVYQKGTP